MPPTPPPLPRLHLLSRPRKRKWYRPLSHPSLYFSLFAGIVCAGALVSFISVLVQQAVGSGVEKRWNIVIVVVLGAGIAATSLFIILGRIFTVRMSFKSMPKPYIPNKAIDVPKKVAEQIMTEYTRTAIIAYISQPTAGKQEGWGRPGSQFSGLFFRSKMKETFEILKNILDASPSLTPSSIVSSTSPSPPPARDFRTPSSLISHPSLPPAARPFILLYIHEMEKVWYARSEPSEGEFAECMKVVGFLVGIIKSHAQQIESSHLNQLSFHTPSPISILNPARALFKSLTPESTPTPNTPERVSFTGHGKELFESPENYHT